MRPYDYAQREGVEPLSWEDFAALAAQLSEALAADGTEIVLGVARAGLFPATQVAVMLRRELYPLRLTRRVDDRVKFDRPVWRVDVPPDVAGRRVAVVDEIADSGETLATVAARARERGAARVVTAVLVAHSWADPRPDHVAKVSDALVIFPWDRQVYQDGRWGPHPEIVEAIRQQEERGSNSPK